jgi:leucyl/phenylalanyl-tRNA--protein transferase
MVPVLSQADPFPDVESALDEPNGLLAVGGGLSVARVLEGYRRGIFPWFSEGDPVLWWAPDPRTVLPTDAVHVSRSLDRRIRKGGFAVTFDRAFDEVIDGCAGPRPGEPSGTWIVPPMRRLYRTLHARGIAHSVEVWMDGGLAGGLYGVALGRMFYGESMFSRRTDASKLALTYLAAHLRAWSCPIIDCQLQTAHLMTLGAGPMARRRFSALVAALVALPGLPPRWEADPAIVPRRAR